MSQRAALNPKQERFCQLYATDREFFGNGVESYVEVYQPDRTKKGWYKIACQSASQLLGNIKVFTRINELLHDGGLNDANVDKQLLFLIDQHEDKTNKLGAIREYNKIKKRIEEKMTDVNIYNNLTDEQLDAVIQSKLNKVERLGAIEVTGGEGAENKGESA